MASDDDDAFLHSSPLSAAGTRRKSCYTFKHLAQLGQYSTATPLRAIAHVDLDAFYAQCESIRLGLPEDQPLAVQQWAGLIAVNYPARDKGITRFLDIAEARKLCPNVILQHVATWREGDTKSQYHDDAFSNIGTHKVSLDPYRAQSRKILACIKAALPDAPLQKVEKASVDEVFIDLSAQVHATLLDRFPELRGPPPYDDPTEHLPRPPTTALDWKSDALIDLDEGQTEDDDPDWDDIALCVASEIIRHVRWRIREELKFTCSAGVAKNKMLAKLGSAHRKPNNQTVVRNRAVQQFLSGFKFTKIRNLGGKLGEQVVAKFETDMVDELRRFTLDELKQKLDDDTAAWLHSIIRGDEHGEVSPRTQIKSMLSAKSFRPYINTRDQAERWLRIFVADIFSRLVEEGVLEHKRRPRSLNLHHRQGGQTWSRQTPIPQGKTVSEEMLFGLSKTLLQQIILEGHVWPCSNLSLSVGGFEEGPAGNLGIGSFLVKGDQAKNMNTALMTAETTTATAQLQLQRHHSSPQNGSAAEPPAPQPSSKRRRTESPGIHAFFRRPDDTDDRDDDANEETGNGEWLCPRCGARLAIDTQIEHEDWHYAKELQDQDRPTAASPHNTQQPSQSRPLGHGGRPKGTTGSNSRKPEKGQMKLTFGKS